MNETKHGNPTEVKRICEWTGKTFYTDWKHRKQRFIDRPAMYVWRKEQNHTTLDCLNCGKPFTKYKVSTQLYCCNTCSLTSDEKIAKLKTWANSDANHWNDPKVQAKVKVTKKKRYGSANYNNMEKYYKTMTRLYGVKCGFQLPSCQSAGNQISKFQRRVYDKVLLTHPDALLEHYLSDVQKSVDIYVPSKKLIIECHGDYWHCNPKKYKASYYNPNVHLTAKQIWKRDKHRSKDMESSGYNVNIVWESDPK